MGWYRVSVVIEGALASEFDIEEEMLGETMGEQAILAAGDGLPTQIWIVYHDHAHGIECECVQYLTDVHPYLTFNMEPEDGKLLR